MTLSRLLHSARRISLRTRRHLASSGAPGEAVPYVVPVPGNLALQKFVNMAPPAVNQKATAIVDETSPLDLNEFMAGEIWALS